jgi:hypothetical protein
MSEDPVPVVEIIKSTSYKNKSRIHILVVVLVLILSMSVFYWKQRLVIHDQVEDQLVIQDQGIQDQQAVVQDQQVLLEQQFPEHQAEIIFQEQQQDVNSELDTVLEQSSTVHSSWWTGILLLSTLLIAWIIYSFKQPSKTLKTTIQPRSRSAKSTSAWRDKDIVDQYESTIIR